MSVNRPGEITANIPCKHASFKLFARRCNSDNRFEICLDEHDYQVRQTELHNVYKKSFF